jgi:hypothetical protein
MLVDKGWSILAMKSSLSYIFDTYDGCFFLDATAWKVYRKNKCLSESHYNVVGTNCAKWAKSISSLDASPGFGPITNMSDRNRVFAYALRTIGNKTVMLKYLLVNRYYYKRVGI